MVVTAAVAVDGRRTRTFTSGYNQRRLHNCDVLHTPSAPFAPHKQGHHRVVPLWPKLRDLLRAYLKVHPTGKGLLFPAEKGRMLRDIRSSLSLAVEAAKLDKHVTTTTLRHKCSRCEAANVGPRRAREPLHGLGHDGSLGMIERHYGHLLSVRNRCVAVDYVDNVLKFRETKSA